MADLVFNGLRSYRKEKCNDPGSRVIHKCYVLLDMVVESYWGTNPRRHFTAGVPGTPVTQNPSED